MNKSKRKKEKIEEEREGFDFQDNQPPMTDDDPNVIDAFIEDSRSNLIQDIANMKSRFSS
jgi:hypothetical protein